MPLLAWKNLLEDRGRFVVGLAGIIFAVALITIQYGIYDGFVKSSALLVDFSKGDLWITAQEIRYFELTLPMPYSDLATAQSVSGVERAEALVVRTSVFRGPGHRIELIRVVGFDPKGTLFRPGPVTDADMRKLLAPDTAIVDRANLSAFNLASGVGETGEIGPSTVRIVALTQGTQPLVSANFVFTSLLNQRIYLETLTPTPAVRGWRGFISPGGYATPPPPANPNALAGSDEISYIMVKAARGVDVHALAHRLEDALPGTRAYTQEEMGDITRTYWKGRTGIGFILGVGALVGFIVGMVVVGQILYTSVSEHVKEYGTMKAMGASDGMLYRIIAIQAIILAVFGFIPGLLLAIWTASFAMIHRGVLISVTPGASAAIFVLTVGMCILSAAFAMQRVTRVDPAIVFKT